MNQINSYMFLDDEFDDYPELIPKRIKVNRLRYQQVKEALKLNRRYNIRSDTQIAEDFDLSPKTVGRIKSSKSYKKYLNRNKHNERSSGNVRNRH